jgi:hypothetical protein
MTRLTLTNYRPANNLWDKAVETLSDKEKLGIDFKVGDKSTILKDVLDFVEKKREVCLEKGWKLKKARKRDHHS